MSEEDRAQEEELRDWIAINAPRPGSEKTKFEEGEPGYGPEYCKMDHCGEEIPIARRQWGYDTCIECATLIERRHRR